MGTQRLSVAVQYKLFALAVKLIKLIVISKKLCIVRLMLMDFSIQNWYNQKYEIKVRILSQTEA